MLRALSVPAGNERGPLFMDQVLAAVHQSNPRKAPIRLLVLRHLGEVTLALDFPDQLRTAIEGQLYAHYPDARLVPLPEEALSADDGMESWSADVVLHPDVFPLRRYTQFEDPLTRQLADPVTAVMTALSAESGVEASVIFTIRPARHNRVHRMQRCIRRLADPFFHHHHRLSSVYRTLALSRWRPLRVVGWCFQRLLPRDPSHAIDLEQSGTRAHEREQNLAAAFEKAGKFLFASTLEIRVSAPSQKREEAMRKVREVFSTFGQFNAPGRAGFRLRAIHSDRRRRRPPTFLLSTDELATLWHPPTSTVKAPAMKVVESRETEPPVRLPTRNDHPDLAVLGQAQFRSRRELCGLLPDDRRRHLLIEGKTGMGKSTLLHRLIGSDIAAGRGVALIDPHGDLCDAVVATVPSQRSNDVVLFDVADCSHPLAFNVLACPDKAHRALTASGIVGAFKKIWGEFFGPRMEHILRNTLLTLLDVPGSTLLSVVRMLGDPEFREDIVRRVTDSVLKNFWVREFAGMPAKLQAEAIAPIYNKVGQLISNPLLRNILGQARSTLNLRKIMDEGKVLLVNLSKGRVGEDASALLGAFLVTALQQAAMSRADCPEDKRPDFFTYIDEFQNFATDAFATILSEARKYRLNLTVANQYLDQIDETTRSAVFGNIGSMIAFQLGVNDAEVLAEQLGGDLTPRDLMALPRFHSYARLLINGQPSRPFTLRTLAPVSVMPHHQHRAGAIRRYCRQRYGRPVDQVENEIAAAFA